MSRCSTGPGIDHGLGRAECVDVHRVARAQPGGARRRDPAADAMPWRRRRQRWSHRTLFFNHVLFGAIGLVAWIYRVVAHSALAGWLALGLLALGALHGLGLVERWTPGRGRHATGRSSDHTRTAYFPVLPA